MAAPQSFNRPGTPEAALDERRRELYKYFQPELFKKETPGVKNWSPDPVLTSYAQLATWRLDVRKCTISLFDQDTQYNVAEATKTLSLEDGASSEQTEDELWIGCTSFSVNGSICLHTLAAPVSAPMGESEFEITNLGADARFKDLPFVTGYPKMRYYYGMTFSTRRNIKIGTFCLLDDKVRKPMNKEQKLFLHTMANNVFLHLELMRERAERKRSLKMNQCLNLFMNAETTLLGKRKRKIANTGEIPWKGSRASSVSSVYRIGKVQNSSKEEKNSSQPPTIDTDSTNHEQEGIEPGQESEITPVEEDNYLRIFQRAADLLMMSLDLEEGGGVVFLDTANAGINAAGYPKSPQSTRKTNPEETFRSVRRGSTCVQTAAEVLASSIRADTRHGSGIDETKSRSESDIEPAFTPFSVDTLGTFIERYPKGKLWIFDSDGQVVSDSEDDYSVAESRAQAEAAILLHHFPGACQIISLPLWDPRSTRWCTCFAWSTSRYRTFTFETDFLHCLAFTNCVTIEMGRLATMASDKLKGDFISSISHELRSPLHGILASVEFLQEETEANSFQQSLVHTVGSCARTLLDTISMILDYTKINAFERDWKRVAKTKKGSQQPLPGEASIPGGLTAQGQPTLNIYGNVDLAAITEEVVEGVTAGQQHHDVLTVDFSDTGSKLKPATKSTDKKINTMAIPSGPISRGQVELILDIEPRSWNYVTQPGAFRRVVMNLVGNALKYTTSGWIRVHLMVESSGNETTQISAGAVEREVPTDMVVLTVTDTGKGISPEYLRTKLFTAFAQEDHLASGTGLGLSLVRSILRMLNGDIDITSTLGSGTTVIVKIPMISQSSSGTPSSGTPSTGSSTTETTKDDSVEALRKVALGTRIAIYNPQRTRQLVKGFDIRAGVFNKIRKYAVEWCKLTLVDWTPQCDVDVVITDEDDLEVFLAESHLSYGTSVLVHCLYTSRPGLVKKYAAAPFIDFMSKPFGPYKLSRALRACIEDGKSREHAGLDTIVEPGAAENEAEHPMVEGKLSSHGVEVNVVEAGGVIGKDDSTNAHMAMDDSDHPSTSATTLTESVDEQEFPFLLASSDPITSPSFAMRPALRDRRTMSPTASELKKIQKDMGYVVSPVTIAGEEATTFQPTNLSVSKTVSPEDKPPLHPTVRDPRLLLVDDNAINLRLLQTFMKKRKYTSVLSAKDGLEAVTAFEAAASSNTAPDIVFMDISMPVMNGFEATRRIRAMEEAANACVAATEARPSALIIALTGLASGKDQSEAFLAGVDLYMTKPVSFKEVGRLLDNWVRNGGAAREGRGVPHGALTGESAVVEGLDEEKVEAVPAGS